MVQAIGAIGNQPNKMDSEYMMILMDLHKLGLKPTGNKAVDKATVEAEKIKIAEKIQDKMGVNVTEKTENPERSKMEEEKLGAMNVGELLKIYHGLV